MRMPAIVVRNHRHRDVAKLRFARQLRFLQVGHADHIHAESAVNVRLSPRRKLRTFHAHVSSAALAGYSDSRACFLDHSRQFATYWIGKSNVCHDSAAEKRV